MNEADLLCHVVDVSHPGWEEQYDVVEGVITELRFDPKQRLVAFNKVDRLTHSEQQAIDERATALLGEHVFTSTIEPEGLESLRAEFKSLAMEGWPTVMLTLPATEGSVLAEIYREGEVLSREERGDRIYLRVRLRAEVLNRLECREGISIFEAPPAA